MYLLPFEPRCSLLKCVKCMLEAHLPFPSSFGFTQSTGRPRDWTLRRAQDAPQEYNTFNNLASEFTYHYFHHCHKFGQIQGKIHEHYYSMEGMSLSHCRKDSAGWKILLRTFFLKTQSTIVFFQIPVHHTSPHYCLNLGWFLLISIFDKLIIHPPVFSQSFS